MTTITLTLTPYQEMQLTEAMAGQVRAWQRIKWEIAEGKRPNASLEGAQLIEQDAMAVQSMIIEQIKANREAG
jgi:hypothetical protein